MHQRSAVHLIATALIGLCCGFGPARAEPFPTDAGGRQLAFEGNSRGATGCVACHGEDGAGLSEAGYPRLTGLSEAYLMAQLRAFRAGTRRSDVMERIAQALNEQEMENVVAYYAGLPVTDTRRPLEDAAAQDLGAKLMVAGKWEAGLPACVRCHGQDAQGVPPVFPRLAGQHAAYLETELQRWRDGKRHNDPSGVMEAVAKGLDARESKAVATYLAGIAPAEAAAAGAERSGRLVYTALRKDSGALLSEGGYAPSAPEEDRIPDDEFGAMILLGKRVFVETQVYAAQYTGNGLNCVNCHLDRGRRAESASMGAAYVRYPRYRTKNDMVNTIEERIQGCFRYSENGTAPPPLSDVMKGLVSYFYFLSTGLPSGEEPAGAGYPELDKPPQAADPQRGALVYARHCAVCHGANGEGTKLGERYQFPPLWGEDSSNWGAGMHRVNTAAAFIKANMPLGNPEALTVQQAWDVAAYINHHERPQDPRYRGDLEATRTQYHDHQCYYGRTSDVARQAAKPAD